MVEGRYRACVELRKANRFVDRSCVGYLVR
jgi:hypothetical protein